MVRKLLLALVALAYAHAAIATVKPPDVPSYVQVVPVWSTNGTRNLTIDPSVTPAPQAGLTEVNPSSSTGRIATLTNAITGSDITASISGTTLTVTAISGFISTQDKVYGPGVTTAVISAQLTGTTGGVGTYTIATSQTVASEAMHTTAINFCLTTANGGPCPQAKFRTLSQVSHILMDDPIKNYGQPGTSHCHEFFGNTHTNAYSTYASIRTRNDSMSAGTDANGTGYWFPCPVKTNPFADGKNYAVKTSLVIIYYLEGDPTRGPRDTKLRRGLRYIFGRDLTDPDNSQLLKYIQALNTAQGHARYTLTSTGNTGFAGQAVYNCAGATPNNVTTLNNNADGNTTNTAGDPFAGTCNAGQDLFILIQGANCWDGQNLWSPTGMGHMLKQIWDNDFGESVCPTNYYRVPALNQEIHFTQQGFSDYGSWRLSSDNTMAATLDALPVCDTNYTTVPCALTAGPHTVLNGLSIHEDWMFGWDDATITAWETNCVGVENNTPHECDSSQIDSGHSLIGGLANQALANGQIMNEDVTRFPTNVPTNMFQIPSQSNGPMTMHTNKH